MSRALDHARGSAIGGATRARAALRRAGWLALALLALLPRARALHSPHDVITAWAVSPGFEEDRTLFVAASRFKLVLRSTDGGLGFEPVNAGLASGNVQALAISPGFVRDRTLWLVEDDRVYRSTDAGERWVRLDTDASMSGLRSLAATADGALWAGSVRTGLWRLPAGAGRWEPVPLGAPADEEPDAGRASADAAAPPAVLALEAGPDGLALAVLSSAGRLFVRDAPSEPFRALDTGVSAPVVAALLPAADDPTRELLVGTQGAGVLRSRDGGASWERRVDGLDDAFVTDLAVARGADGTRTLFACTNRAGVFVARDDGPWTARHAGLRQQTPQTDVHYSAVLPSPGFARDGLVYVAGFEGLHVSHRGKPWQHLEVLPGKLVRNLALSPRFAEERSFLLSTYGRGLLANRGGLRFTRADEGGFDYPDGVGMAADGTLAYGVPSGLRLSTDGGRSWHDRRAAPRGFPRVIAFAPDHAESGIVLASVSLSGPGEGRGVFHSADRGLSWTRVGPEKAYRFAWSDDWEQSGRVWAASPEGLVRSDDRGRSWSPVTSCPEPHIRDVAVRGAGEAEQVLVSAAGWDSAVLLLSRDGGASWERADRGLEDCRPLLVGFGGDTHAFAATHDRGVFVSTDGAWSWRPTQGGPRSVFAFEVSRSFARDRVLVAGAYDGAWISNDAGGSWWLLEPVVGAAPDAEQQPAEDGGDR